MDTQAMRGLPCQARKVEYMETDGQGKPLKGIKPDWRTLAEGV